MKNSPTKVTGSILPSGREGKMEILFHVGEGGLNGSSPQTVGLLFCAKREEHIGNSG